jgi:hypothetical protein
MANIKFRPMEMLSGWIEYKLVTDKLDPPVFRCRVRPVTGLSWIDGVPVGETQFKRGRATLEVAVEAIAEWDLTQDGKPIPVTPENKMGFMIEIIDAQVEGRETGVLLGIAICQDAQNRDNFLKN